MTRKSALAALALALLPSLGLAQGCRGDLPDHTASSCMDGHVWDEAKGMCVEQPSS